MLPTPAHTPHGDPQLAKSLAAVHVPPDALSPGLVRRQREGNLALLLAGLKGDVAGELRPGGSRRAASGPEALGDRGSQIWGLSSGVD